MPTCRFGAGLFYNPTPPELPPPLFHQLACSNCLVYVAMAKQQCDLEYEATPAGLLPHRLPLTRSCKPLTQIPNGEQEHSSSIDPRPTTHTSLGVDADSTGERRIKTQDPTSATTMSGAAITKGKLIEYPQPIPIPEDLSHDNFFCDVLLGGNRAHCSLWRDCCNAAVRCCNETIPTVHSLSPESSIQGTENYSKLL